VDGVPRLEEKADAISLARGEAASGFPHVIQFRLPAMRNRRAQKFPEEICRLDALLSVMAELDDTWVLYRGGVEALDAVKSGAKAVLVAGGYGSENGRQHMRKLDRELIRRHLSPGGSADLLAATIFLDTVERGQIRGARISLGMQTAGDDFASFVWGIAGGKPIQNTGAVPASTPLSEAISQALRGRGFKFVGSVIVYMHGCKLSES
jgi:hypothetical protein